MMRRCQEENLIKINQAVIAKSIAIGLDHRDSLDMFHTRYSVLIANESHS